MAGHSRSKNGVASACLCPGHPRSYFSRRKDEDTRHKAGHDAVQCWRSDQSCDSSVSPPDTSTLPGAGSRLKIFTVPSSTSIE
ncbi:hypothetical protein D1614_24080 [Maribellus luteus]|uniref:Uncharacterized protein n=1 Tax=Maribellus luteus TaxID=2305463 RepID=A0A399SNS7_9BACT|nr:hypothetical protein D1614_24080 [Maribellus luteus]